jgi:anti-anti-sigma regulatory factor
MTFRIQRSTTDDVVVLALSGDIAADHAAELQALLDAEADEQVVLDLKNLLSWIELASSRRL